MQEKVRETHARTEKRPAEEREKEREREREEREREEGFDTRHVT